MDPVDHAITQLCIREATGQNDGIPAERYNRGERTAWCASFVLWCFEQAGRPIHRSESEWWQMRSVAFLGERLKERGLWLRSSALPQRNDLVFLAHRGRSDAGRGRHVGIVESVPLAGSGRVTSIDGNWGDAVSRVVRVASDPEITGYGRVFAAGASATS